MCFWLTRFNINRTVKKIKNLQQARLHNPVSDEVIAKEVAIYHRLAQRYAKLHGKKKWPFAREMRLACLRTCAMLDDSTAQYLLGKHLLEEAKCRQQWQVDGVFASENNERMMRQLYDEAHAYLTAAQKLNHIQATRLHGLCYINGWGVAADKNLGFELVMNSIDKENSWARVPQIFKEIGLNKPEFFSALAQHRKG